MGDIFEEGIVNCWFLWYKLLNEEPHSYESQIQYLAIWYSCPDDFNAYNFSSFEQIIEGD